MYRRHDIRPVGTTGLISGILVGILAARILPPFLAMACGSARARAGHDPFETLIADHQRFRALLARMNEATATLQRAQLLLRLKRGLAAHAMAEEDVVYPMLQDEAGAKPDPTHLYAEHAALKVLLYRLEKKVLDGGDWTEEVGALSALLTEHARHEEEVDFPRLRNLLGREGGVTLARKISREKALVL
jgi:iron-sulfur cluster repair protein YtfE (RIC family)